jgi:hypothetical protein
MNEWNIQSRGHACQSCDSPFTHKQVYHTVLFDEKRDFLRKDVCQKCWDEQYSHSRDGKGFISCWQGEYEAPPAPVEAIQKENAETLLRKLVELNDPKFVAASYILAVMLERKRILKVKEQIRTAGKRIFVYEQPKTGDIFTIPDPDLQLNQLEEVQRAVGDLLEHGLPVETPAPAAPAVEGTSAEAAPTDSAEPVSTEAAPTETATEPEAAAR